MGAFDGRVAIVTGAARNLGAEYASFFAEDSASVVVADVDREGASQTAKQIEATGARTMAVEVDVTSLESTRTMAADVHDAFGRIDILVNNAGIWRDLQGTFESILDVDPDYWDLVMGVNTKGALLCSRAVVPIMTEQGWGRIVNISSIGSRMAGGVYGVSKLALNQLTYSISAVTAPLGITCNAVAPGVIWNEATQNQIPAEFRDQLLAGNHIRRAGTGRDLYGAIKWLCSDDAAWVTGQTIYPNGGGFTNF
jgi:3-oxoacyl-[acyl-carrier protein] reductase